MVSSKYILTWWRLPVVRKRKRPLINVAMLKPNQFPKVASWGFSARKPSKRTNLLAARFSSPPLVALQHCHSAASANLDASNVKSLISQQL